MIIYNWIKVLHVISAAALFGTGIGTAMYMLLANKTKDTKLISMTTKNVVRADWIFTGIAGFLQPITGLTMIIIKPYPITTFWVMFSILGYFIAAFCWFPVAYIQVKLYNIAKVSCEQNTQLPPHYYSYYRTWLTLGWPAFIVLIAVFFLMSNRPESLNDLLSQLKLN